MAPILMTLCLAAAEPPAFAARPEPPAFTGLKAEVAELKTRVAALERTTKAAVSAAQAEPAAATAPAYFAAPAVIPPGFAFVNSGPDAGRLVPVAAGSVCTINARGQRVCRSAK